MRQIHTKDEIIEGTRKWFEDHPCFKKAIVGISGGKDSSVVAAILCQAIGKERVVGVMMPNFFQKDIGFSEEIIKFLGIEGHTIDIGEINRRFIDSLDNGLGISQTKFSNRTITNIPPRIRMTVLYAVAAQLEGCVVGTGNLSEALLGWGTLWGDTVADFNPIKSLLCEEVIQLGKELGLPDRFVLKPPSDGLTGKTDEENFGFTYADLNKAYTHWYNLVIEGQQDLSDFPEDMDKDLYLKIINRIRNFQFKRDLVGNVPTIY